MSRSALYFLSEDALDGERALGLESALADFVGDAKDARGSYIRHVTIIVGAEVNRFELELSAYLSSCIGNENLCVRWIREPAVSSDWFLDVLHKTDVIIFISDSEEGMEVIRKGMANGTPVMIPDTALSAANLIRDGVTGFHYRANDTVSFAISLKMLCLSPRTLIKSIAERAKQMLDGAIDDPAVTAISQRGSIVRSQYRPLVSIVVIGRNEGGRLLRCMDSIAAVRAESFDLEKIYVDSDSADTSVQHAARKGFKVLSLQSQRPSAALARNIGWRAARGEFVLFLDGDTILHPEFINKAIRAMLDPSVAVVWGHRREINPAQSLYVRVLDLDWIYAPGKTEFCGGDALMRREILEEVNGFDASLIAGEEPELCRRIRALGYSISHIDAPMTLHDLAITRFSAYWRRAFRAGYAYAEIAARFRDTSDPLWQKDARRNLVRGGLMVAMPVVLLAALSIPVLLIPLLMVGLSMLTRSVQRCRWKASSRLDCVLYAMHSWFQQIPIFCGQVSALCDASRGDRRGLIEYKREV